MLFVDEATRRKLKGEQRAWLTKQAILNPPKKKRTVPRINHDKRRHLVDLVTAVLRTGEPTLFAFEATCRNGLRSRMCAAGWKWSEADALAEDIVAEALRLLGAKRPSWSEGQPEFTQNGGGALIERTRCIRCRSPLEEDQRKFCSSLCANAHHMHLAAIKEAEEETAYDQVAQYRSRAKC